MSNHIIHNEPLLLERLGTSIDRFKRIVGKLKELADSEGLTEVEMMNALTGIVMMEFITKHGSVDAAIPNVRRFMADMMLFINRLQAPEEPNETTN
jgi:hypothetical protein